jgi:hypothetical protein
MDVGIDDAIAILFLPRSPDAETSPWVPRSAT